MVDRARLHIDLSTHSWLYNGLTDTQKTVLQEFVGLAQDQANDKLVNWMKSLQRVDIIYKYQLALKVAIIVNMNVAVDLTSEGYTRFWLEPRRDGHADEVKFAHVVDELTNIAANEYEFADSLAVGDFLDHM